MKHTLISLVLVMGCLGGQSGTPTPFVPDPGCASTGQSPVDDWDETQALFSDTTGTWSGDCGGRPVTLTLPAIEEGSVTGERVHYAWQDYGDEGVTPRECRDGHEIRMAVNIEFADALEPFEVHLTRSRYVSTHDGAPAEVDHYARAWFEVFGTASFEEDDSSALTMPLADGPAAVSASVYALLSEDGTTLDGSLEWFGYAPNSEPPLVPPSGDDGGTDNFDPNPGSEVTDPATLISTCSFTLRQN